MRGVIAGLGRYELRAALPEFLDCEPGLTDGSACLRWRDRAGRLRQDDGRKPAGSDRGRSRATAAQSQAGFRAPYPVTDRTRKSRPRRRPAQIRTLASSADRKRARGTGPVVCAADEISRLCAHQANSGSLFSSARRAGRRKGRTAAHDCQMHVCAGSQLRGFGSFDGAPLHSGVIGCRSAWSRYLRQTGE